MAGTVASAGDCGHSPAPERRLFDARHEFEGCRQTEAHPGSPHHGAQGIGVDSIPVHDGLEHWIAQKFMKSRLDAGAFIRTHGLVPPVALRWPRLATPRSAAVP